MMWVETEVAHSQPFAAPFALGMVSNNRTATGGVLVSITGSTIEPSEPAISDQRVRPFLRWVGGKRWLVPSVKELLRGTNYRAYHEPFLGGGAMFFGLHPRSTSYLADLNADLIQTYQAVKADAKSITDHLEKYVNDAQTYYQLRAAVPSDPAEAAARFIYLNHTSFNGIYRVNRLGQYNVPFGNRPNPNIPSLDVLQAVALRLQEVHLAAGSFESMVANVREGDFVFLDPPYTVAHNNNGFIKYNQRLFSFDDQKKLAEVITQIVARKAYYVLTNAAHDSIDALFKHLGRRFVVSRPNAVGGRSATRGQADEYLFTNLGE